ncbi:MAG: filamentous hemagglutinin N-terminal domain-containing protein, partial [Alphaproteobacteria bacterium]|nr:filamentous hemagglutinin N-terminal domain-containing protein [Alphaproteobacteria bacterium]
MAIITTPRRAADRERHYSSASAIAMLASLATTLAVGAGGTAQAGPNGGTVVGGAGTISSIGNTTEINQSSSRLIIDWASFNIDPNELVKFTQPGASAIALNRVLDGLPSEIRGQLLANGNVWIVNHHGVTIHQSAQIDVGGLLVTTSDIANEDFMAGNYKFTVPGAEGAKVVNRGNITFAEAGLAGLVAPGVENSGTIVGKLGSVVVAGQDTFAVDLAGDGLMAFQVDPAASATSVVNSGTIKNDGGYILITAAQADDLVSSVVNVSGTVDASSSTANGGLVEVYGKDVTIASTAEVRADGATGGGKVLLGGDKYGAGTSNAFLADTLTAQSGSVISASATVDGDGGFVETSGHSVALETAVSASGAGNGTNGLWLIDPDDIEVGSSIVGTLGGTFSYVDETVFAATLAGGTDVTITTDPAGPGIPADGVDDFDNGDIVVTSALNLTGASTLTLDADRAIQVNATITTTGSLDLQAAGALPGGEGIDINAGITAANLTLTSTGGRVDASTGALVVSGLTAINASGFDVILTNAGNDFVGAVSADGTNISLTDANALTLGDIDDAGNLVVVAGGAVDDGADAGATNNVDVTGTTSVMAGGNDVTLDNASNTFGGAVTIAGANVAVTDGTSALELGDIDASGSLTVVAGGAVTQSGGGVAGDQINVGTTTAINAAGNAVTLNGSLNDFIGAVSVAGTDVNLRDANALVLGDIDAT